MYIYVLFCIVSMVFTCNKKLYQQSEKAMKEKRFNKSSTISIDIALRKKLIGTTRITVKKNQCYLYDVSSRNCSIVTSTINF